jgi:hypothetical protein
MIGEEKKFRVISLLSKIEFLFGQHSLPQKHELKKSPFGKGD